MLGRKAAARCANTVHGLRAQPNYLRMSYPKSTSSTLTGEAQAKHRGMRELAATISQYVKAKGAALINVQSALAPSGLRLPRQAPPCRGQVEIFLPDSLSALFLSCRPANTLPAPDNTAAVLKVRELTGMG